MKKPLFYVTTAIVVCLSANAFANLLESNKKKKKPAPTAAAAPTAEADKNKTATIESKTKNCVKITGLFNLYRDTTDGKLYMVVNDSQLQQEFIHFTYTENGVIAAGHHRGQFRGSRIFTIKKSYGNLEFEQVNTAFYFDPNNAISKSAEANISNSPLGFEKILAENKKTKDYLIDADELFLSEKLHQIKEGGRPGSEGFKLGNLTKGKTQYNRIRNYPENTDLVVRYVYDNPAPTAGGGNEVTDERSVSILLQHSLLKMPKNNFKPRLDDARLGYFTEQVNDMTSTASANYRDLIHRWNLEKKDPSAAKSEPVKPITWWIENTTPKEYRETIKKAALEWNKAFEPLGFINAIQVLEQPDTASWDAGDIRYNVLRWTSSPNPPFGGYGPSFVNPRTGEILGADIMFEFVFLTNRFKFEKIFKTGLSSLDESDKESNGSVETTLNHSHLGTCSAGEHLHAETLLGQAMLAATAAPESEKSRLIEESIHYLVLHEMGHTFGLMHNMKASQLNTPEQLKDRNYTQSNGLIGSVMDYPAVNLHPQGKPVQYCQTTPGPYDKWVIEYGYSIGQSDENAEKDRLRKIAEKNIDPSLTFGNDADDMRSPGKGIDPRVMVNDLSSDAITYGIERVQLTQSLMKNLKPTDFNGDAGYQELISTFGVLSGNYSTMMGVISRYIGGVYVNRPLPGQANAPYPYTPVPFAQQKQALDALNQYAFAPNAMEVPADIIPYLQTQRRGFGFFAKEEDPKLHARVMAMQSGVLDHVLNPKTLLRISDSRLYGNRLSVQEVIDQITNGIFMADLNTPTVNTHRMLLQEMYVSRLIRMADKESKSGYDAISRAAAYSNLMAIQKMLKSSPGTSAEVKAHRAFIVLNIEKALDD